MGCLLYITWLSWKVFLIVLGLSVVALGSCRELLKRGGQLLTKAREDQDLLFNQFRTVTEGVKELKLHYQRRQDFLAEDLQTTAGEFRRHNIGGLTLFAITDSWGKLIFFFAVGCVLFVLPNLMTINAQTLSGYVLTFTYLIGPMESISNKLPILSKANVSLHKIEVLGLSLASRAETATVPPKFKSSWQCLGLKGVTHTYRSEQEDMNFTLGPIDLTLQPGELVLIIGGNGSGKSTLAKLIAGLYIPESGEIWLDKQPITSPNREWYRQHFSVIFSDFYLFERLLGFDRPDLDTQARYYLRQLQLDHKVKVEHGKLSTTALSQGQRKRLALLTAYLEDRPIYLFDEWAADQDPTFKELFYTQFLPQLRDKGKTVLAISHDEQYFHMADRLIKLDYGKVVYDKYRLG
jgi:putative ATP-binding cassette transporter